MSRISIGCWNCNGIFWSSPNLIYNALRPSYILFLIETRESPIGPIQFTQGTTAFQSVYMGLEAQSVFKIRGTSLVWSKTPSRVSLVTSDDYASFMWIQVRGMPPLPDDIFIAACYFHPTSDFALHKNLERDLYQDLYTNIVQYSTLG